MLFEDFVRIVAKEIRNANRNQQLSKQAGGVLKYRTQYQTDITMEEIEQKIEDGEISVGKPIISKKEGEVILKKRCRYFIKTPD